MRNYLTVSREGLVDKFFKFLNSLDDEPVQERKRDMDATNVYMQQFSQQIEKTLGSSQWIQNRKMIEGRVDAEDIYPVLVESADPHSLAGQTTAIVDAFYKKFKSTTLDYTRRFNSIAETVENSKSAEDYAKNFDQAYPKLLGMRPPKMSSYPPLPSGIVYADNPKAEPIKSATKWLAAGRNEKKLLTIRALTKTEVIQAGQDILSLVKKAMELDEMADDENVYASINWYQNAWSEFSDVGGKDDAMRKDLENRLSLVNTPLQWYIGALLMTAFALESWCLRSLK